MQKALFRSTSRLRKEITTLPCSEYCKPIWCTQGHHQNGSKWTASESLLAQILASKWQGSMPELLMHAETPPLEYAHIEEITAAAASQLAD